MKVVCINNEISTNLVIGQHYEIRILEREPINGDYCVVTGLIFSTTSDNIKLYKTHLIEQLREIKLKKIMG